MFRLYFDWFREYQRRTLIDRKDLLVKVKTPGLNENDDEENEVSLNDELTKQSDSSVDTSSDEINHQNESDSNVSDRIDGRQRSKIVDTTVLQSNESDMNKIDSSVESDLTNFDWVNDCDERF